MPVVPRRVPISQVTRSASPPPMTSRRMARPLAAPPICADTAPVIVSAISTATNVTGIRLRGGSRIASSGSIAPRVKASAEETRGCQGLTSVVLVDAQLDLEVRGRGRRAP